MSLDALLCCTCMRDGKAKPHSFPDHLTLAEPGEPILTGDPCEQQGDAHDHGLGESCEHPGYLLSLFLGHMKNLRGFLRGFEGTPGPRFPVLPEKVLHDGTPTGHWLSGKVTAKRLQEVDTVLHSSDLLADSKKQFFTNMKFLCQASISTGNPLMS